MPDPRLICRENFPAADLCASALGANLLAAATACLLPLSAPASEHASAGAEPGANEANAEDAADPNAASRGFNLGEFSIRTYYPVEAKRSTAVFTLYGIVSRESAGDFSRLLDNRRIRVRDQIIVATRLVPLSDFDDPQLKKFRRRILLRLRRALPELKLEDIYVSEFQLEVHEI